MSKDLRLRWVGERENRLRKGHYFSETNPAAQAWWTLPALLSLCPEPPPRSSSLTAANAPKPTSLPRLLTSHMGFSAHPRPPLPPPEEPPLALGCSGEGKWFPTVDDSQMRVVLSLGCRQSAYRPGRWHCRSWQVPPAEPMPRQAGDAQARTNQSQGCRHHRRKATEGGKCGKTPGNKGLNAPFVDRGELNPQAVLFLQKNVSGLQMAFRTKGAKTWHLPAPGHQGSKAQPHSTMNRNTRTFPS